jgi:protein required for attachment to host cells
MPAAVLRFARRMGAWHPLFRKVDMKNWLVIANASRARVLEDSGLQGAKRRATPYVHVADLVHPQSRQKGMALDDDRPGHAHAEGGGQAGTSYAPHTDPRQREHDRFAREVAQMLDEGIAAHRCAGLVLVASSPFLGQLKVHLGEQARKAIVHTLDADYTSLTDAELAARLAQVNE